MKRFLVAIFIVLMAWLSIYWWGRSAPLTKAQRAIDHGDPGEAVEILIEALDNGSLSLEKEEAMRELLAKSYWNKGAIDSSEQCLRTLIEKFPQNFYASLGLGVLNLLRDRATFGVAYLEEAKRLDPKDIRPYLILGQYYSGIRDYQKATENISTGLGQFPNNERLAELSGDLLFNQGRYHEAMVIYQPLHLSSPVDRDLRVKIARCLLFSGEIQKASEILNDLRPSSGTDENIELLLARILFQQGQRKKSAEIAERLYREDNRRLTSGISWANSLAEDENFGEAEKVLTTIGETLLPLGGDFSTPVGGQTFYDLERLENVRAVSKYQRIAYYQARATLAGIQNRYSEATQYLEQAINIDQGDFGTIAQMAELARLKNEPENRLKWANTGVSLYKNHPAALLLRAGILLDLRHTQDAVVDTRLVADSYPKLAYAQALLSKAWMMQKNPGAALAAAKHAVRLNPGTPEAQLALATATATLGLNEEADGAFRSAVDINPRFAEARNTWGIWLMSMGHTHEANIQFQEASRLEPLIYKPQR